MCGESPTDRNKRCGLSGDVRCPLPLMKYRIVGGLTAEIQHLPDKELSATLASAKVVRSAYVSACKTDKRPTLWKIKDEWIQFVEDLKTEIKRRKELTQTAETPEKTDVPAQTT